MYSETFFWCFRGGIEMKHGGVSFTALFVGFLYIFLLQLLLDTRISWRHLSNSTREKMNANKTKQKQQQQQK